MLERCGHVAPLECELAAQNLTDGRLFPPRLDLGDRGPGRFQIVGVELELCKLHQGRRVVGPLGKVRQDGAGVFGAFERVGQDLGSHHGEGDVVRVAGQVLLENSIGLLRLAVPVGDGRFQTGELGRPGIASTGLAQQLPGLGLLALLFESQHGEVLGRGPPLPLGPQLVDSRQGAVVPAKLHVDLGLPKGDCWARNLSRGTGLLELLGRALQVARSAPGLANLAAHLVQCPTQVRGQRSQLELSEQRLDDRLGFLGIARLKDRPCRPELVLRIEVALPQSRLQVLAAQALLLAEHQGHAITRLGLGQPGKLLRGLLQVTQGAGPQLGLRQADGLILLARA